MLKKYSVKITETYIYDIEVKASSKKEALEKAKKCYEECDEKYVFVASSTTHDNTKFKVDSK